MTVSKAQVLLRNKGTASVWSEMIWKHAVTSQDSWHLSLLVECCVKCAVAKWYGNIWDRAILVLRLMMHVYCWWLPYRQMSVRIINSLNSSRRKAWSTKGLSKRLFLAWCLLWTNCFLSAIPVYLLLSLDSHAASGLVFECCDFPVTMLARCWRCCCFLWYLRTRP